MRLVSRYAGLPGRDPESGGVPPSGGGPADIPTFLPGRVAAGLGSGVLGGAATADHQA
jgi:hypothetical protein